ncbi:MAG: histidine phosphatase family protein [Clostridia bacterium]|nr:histidine phosphatase family protein [Clostridia bacterium]
MKLIFIRHGDPDYVNDTITERGKIEVEALTERVLKWDVDEIFLSPLGRAQDTAKPYLEKSGRHAETLPWLREFNGHAIRPHTGKQALPWDFMPDFWTNVPELYDKDFWYKAPVMQTGDVEEQAEWVYEEFDKLLAQRGYIRDGRVYKTEKGNNKTLVFFCHLGVQLLILSHLFGISAPCLWQNFFVAPTSVTVVETQEREEGRACFRCQKLGDTAHLEAAGIKPSRSGFFEEVYGEEKFDIF